MTGYNNGQILIWSQGNFYDCSLTDTESNLTFNATGLTQVIEPSYTFRYTTNKLYGSYFAITNALANLLTGAIRGFWDGIFTYKTRISDTALMGAFQAANGSSLLAGYSGLSPSLMTPEIKSLARNLTMDALIEELSRNLTLSLFSATRIQ